MSNDDWFQWFRVQTLEQCHSIIAKVVSGDWVLPRQRLDTHHNDYSVLLKWVGAGKPPGADDAGA